MASFSLKGVVTRLDAKDIINRFLIRLYKNIILYFKNKNFSDYQEGKIRVIKNIKFLTWKFLIIYLRVQKSENQRRRAGG